MGLTMPSSAVAVMGLSSKFEQGRHQSSLQVAESVGNSVITAVAGSIYTALLFVDPEKLSYSASLGAVLVLLFRDRGAVERQRMARTGNRNWQRVNVRQPR